MTARALSKGVVLLEDDKGAVLVDDVLSVHISDGGDPFSSLRFEVWVQLRNNIRVHLGRYPTAEKAQDAADHFATCHRAVKYNPDRQVMWRSPHRWRKPRHTITLADGTVLDADCIEDVTTADYGYWTVDALLSEDPDRLLYRRGQEVGRFGQDELAAQFALDAFTTAIKLAKTGVNVTVDAQLRVVDTPAEDASGENTETTTERLTE